MVHITAVACAPQLLPVEITCSLNKMSPSHPRAPSRACLPPPLRFVDHGLKMRWRMLYFDILIHKVGHSFALPDLYDRSFAGNDLDKIRHRVSCVTLEHERADPGVPGLDRGRGDHVERHATLEAVSEGKHQI